MIWIVGEEKWGFDTLYVKTRTYRTHITSYFLLLQSLISLTYNLLAWREISCHCFLCLVQTSVTNKSNSCVAPLVKAL